MIDPIEDARGVDQEGGLLTTWIPGFPEQTRVYPRPETHELLEFDPPAELREAFARMALESRTFSQVVTNRDDIDHQGKVFTLSIRLNQLSFDLTRNTHRVGVLAPALWLVAWPMGRMHTTLLLDIELQTSLGQKVWGTQITDAARVFLGDSSVGRGVC